MRKAIATLSLPGCVYERGLIWLKSMEDKPFAESLGTKAKVASAIHFSLKDTKIIRTADEVCEATHLKRLSDLQAAIDKLAPKLPEKVSIYLKPQEWANRACSKFNLSMDLTFAV